MLEILVRGSVYMYLYSNVLQNIQKISGLIKIQI